MVDRPSIQHWRIEPSSIPSRIYTGWSDDNFYVAFSVGGTAERQELHRNFVDYQLRRAWGEDLCQVLIQPVYDDNSLGPVTYLACKPNGVCMVKRRLDPRIEFRPVAGDRRNGGAICRRPAAGNLDRRSGDSVAAAAERQPQKAAAAAVQFHPALSGHGRVGKLGRDRSISIRTTGLWDCCTCRNSIRRVYARSRNGRKRSIIVPRLTPAALRPASTA